MIYQYIISTFGKSDNNYDDFINELNLFCYEFNVLPFFLVDEVFYPGNFRQFVNSNNGFDLTPEISYNLASETIKHLKQKIEEENLENECFIVFKTEKMFFEEEDVIFI